MKVFMDDIASKQNTPFRAEITRDQTEKFNATLKGYIQSLRNNRMPHLTAVP